MSKFEKELLRRIEKLEEENKKLKGIEENSIPSYHFNSINFIQLESIVEIEQNFLDKDIFNNWFNYKKSLSKEDISFLKKLISKNERLIDNYREEDLKMNFIAPILNRVDFLSLEKKIRSFFETPLKYETKSFILNGTINFLVSKGLKYPKLPYFFIQEFKKSKKNSDPEPQLLAELISAIELNNWKTIKGAYIVGAIWNFVILEKLDLHKYQYFVSRNFDSTRLDDLKSIYKNLLFVKNEIFGMVKNE